jgi:hypothetical protein
MLLVQINLAASDALPHPIQPLVRAVSLIPTITRAPRLCRPVIIRSSITMPTTVAKAHHGGNIIFLVPSDRTWFHRLPARALRLMLVSADARRRAV